MNNIYAVILAGGKGERFWPKSREKNPKQLLALIGRNTMLQETIDRIDPLISHGKKWIITNSSLVDPIKKSGIKNVRIVGEPLGKNTAPAIALAASEIYKENPEAVMIVLPSDHYIGDLDGFRQVLKQAIELANREFLVTIGLRPDRPEIGYGYIERGEILPDCTIPSYMVKSFREKPDLETAHRFYRSGYFYWNGGIFVWKAGTILKNFEMHMPELYGQLMEWRNRGGLGAGARPLAEFYDKVEKISIDYGIMEKAEKVAVVKGDFHWDDMGSWEALERFYEKDEQGNLKVGKVELLECKNNITVSDDGLVAAIGVNDLIIVKSGNAVLVCHRSKAQAIRSLLEQVRFNENLKEYL